MHPDIADVDKAINSELEEGGDVAALQQSLLKQFGETIELQKIPQDDHD